MKVIGRYGIHFKPYYAPVKIDAEHKHIYFKHVAPEENKCIINEDSTIGEVSIQNDMIKLPFDMLHLAPPQAAPKFIRNSSLSNDTGWLDVDFYSLQHNMYPNIFGLGDVAGLPTAKTGGRNTKTSPSSSR